MKEENITYSIAKGIEPESIQASGSRCQSAGNAEGKEASWTALWVCSKKKNQILGNSIAPTGWDKLYKLSNRHDKTIIFKNAHLGDKSIQM